MTQKKRLLYLTVLVMAVAAMGLVGWWWWRQRKVTTVQTARVKRLDLTAVVTASGEIKPKDYVNISANAFGKIVAIRVKEGDAVRRGQVLAQLEAVQPEAEVQAQQAQLAAAESDVQSSEALVQAMQAGVKTAQAAVARAQAQRERSEQDYRRAQSLHEERLISRAALEQAQAEFNVAVATVEESEARSAQAEAQWKQATAQTAMARERVRQARANLERLHDVLTKHTFFSPLDGVVTDLPVNEGENVVPGVQNAPGSLLMTIADLSVITTEVLVDETDIAAIQPRQTAQVKVDALPDRVFLGRVTEIGNTAVVRATGLAAAQSTTSSQQAKDFKVVITLSHPDASLRPGLSATAEIVTATRAKALSVPLQSLTVRQRRDLELEGDGGRRTTAESEDLEGVFLVRDGKAFFRPVNTGISGLQDIEILKGLGEGDEIVTGSFEALRSLRTGDRIRVDNASADGAARSF